MMIGVRNLRYTYSGADEPAIRVLDFTVDTGEVFGFLGPNSAGKILQARDYSGAQFTFPVPETTG